MSLALCARVYYAMYASVLNLICPSNCLICDEQCDGLFCSSCSQKLITPDENLCPRCSGRRFHRNVETGDCDRCHEVSFRFSKVLALGEYEGELRNLILRMKTDRNGLIARGLAELFIEKRGAKLLDYDLIVPIPMHRVRRWERGVNAPEIFAEKLAQFLKIKADKRILKRIRYTELQHRLSVTGRGENLRGAFQFMNSSLKNQNVLLVDDIFTTGATCNEAAKMLFLNGAKSVNIAVIARAEGRAERPERELVEI